MRGGRRVGEDRKSASAGFHPVTFRGRGLGLRSATALVLLVCPLCSQRNGERMAGKGVCEWCAYEPAVRDEERSTAQL